MTVVTRFAPSPTGMLHVGGARTALFNWLFSRHHGGRFHLRIEDTDRKRSTDEAIEAILGGLRWLELDWDGDTVFQSTRLERHAAVANQLLESGKAYRCYCTPDELAEMRETAKREGRPIRYDGRWRDRDPSEAPCGVAPAIRIKAPVEGETVIQDLVQGEVRVANEQLDDMVILRGDGTPTYMLSVVVDDLDMGITHVIRGDDHLTNAFRQVMVFRAMGWNEPLFAHIPLIHGADGAKLSKRHGAVSVLEFREQGFLPEAMCNYLLRLGWGHGDEEIIPRDKAVEWFDIDAVGRSAARFDYAKLTHLNTHYMQQADEARLIEEVARRIAAMTGEAPDAEGRNRLAAGMGGLKMRARTLQELAENAQFYAAARPIEPNDKARKLLSDEALELLADLAKTLRENRDWSESGIEETVKAFADAKGIKLGAVAQPLRASLTGSNVSPGIFEVMAILGPAETLGRIEDSIAQT